MSEDEKVQAEAPKELENLRLVAGVFLDPETQLMEVRPGAEGVNPYAVLAGALYSFAQQALELAGVMIPGQAQQGQSQVLRANGPLPGDMRQP